MIRAFLVGGNPDASYGANILKTIDGGETWEVVHQSNLNFRRVAFQSDSVGYATGGGYIYKTINQGETWEILPFYTLNGLNDIVFTEPGRKGYIAGSNGLMLKLENKDNHPESESEKKIIQNYPNPCNYSTTIEFQIKQQCKVTLSVYNIQGRLLQTVIDKTHQPDIYYINYYTYNLASGIYVIMLKCGSEIETKKIVVLR